MGNKYVRGLGIAIAVVGIILYAIGLTLMSYQEVDRTYFGYSVSSPYKDLGASLYNLSLAAIASGVILIIIGFVLRPSIREVKLARRLLKRNLARLQEYEREDEEFDLEEENGGLSSREGPRET